MTEKTEALRLANDLEIDYHGDVVTHEAAAELRRLSAENEAIHQAITDPENQPSQFGTVTFAMYEALEAQCDALLEALQALYDEQQGPPLIRHQAAWEAAMQKARAAIKAVEGEKT